MKGSERLEDWIGRVALSGAPFDSVHFDELSDDTWRALSGIDLGVFAQDRVRATVSLLTNRVSATDVRYVAVDLPIGMSDDLTRWSPGLWEHVASVAEPPSLYLVRNADLFPDDHEEYRRPVPPPFADVGCRAVFRSFRDREAMDRSWEFGNGV